MIGASLNVSAINEQEVSDIVVFPKFNSPCSLKTDLVKYKLIMVLFIYFFELPTLRYIDRIK